MCDGKTVSSAKTTKFDAVGVLCTMYVDLAKFNNVNSKRGITFFM